MTSFSRRYPSRRHSCHSVSASLSQGLLGAASTRQFDRRATGPAPKELIQGIPDLAPRTGPLSNIVYDFSGVTFSDARTLTGSFTTNDARTALLGYDITSSTGTNIGLHYTTLNTGSSSTSLPFILVLSTPSLDNILQVTFDN